MSAPNQTDYISFIRNVMGIDTTVLPDASPYIPMTLSIALEIVDPQIDQISDVIYPLAVYNFAGDRLLNFAPDQEGQTFFTNARTSYQINSFVAGVIQASGDESTNESMVVPEAFKTITIMDLQSLKTPYGRTYLEFAQQTGTLWGLT